MSGAVAGACDAGVAAAALPQSNPHPRATLAATILGSSVAFIDGSVVNVALPALARDLGAGPAELSWTINAYLLPLGALIRLGARGRICHSTGAHLCRCRRMGSPRALCPAPRIPALAMEASKSLARRRLRFEPGKGTPRDAAAPGSRLLSRHV
jgi:hypothetical protein